MINRVIIAKDARKDLKKLPFYVVKKLNLWTQVCSPEWFRGSAKAAGIS